MSDASPDHADLRLLPPVLAAWAAAWLTPLLPQQVAWLLVAGCIVVAGLNRRRRLLLLVLLFAAVSVASMAVRIHALHAGPVPELAAEHRQVIVRATVTADPTWTQLPGFGGAPRTGVRAELRVQQVMVDGVTSRVRSPVLAVGDADGWEQVQFGSTVLLSGSLQPASELRPLSAVIFTRGPPQLVAQPSMLLQGTEQMRHGLRTAVTGTSDDVQGLLPALVVGDTSELSDVLVSDLRASGLTHLTAVSGANVAIVLGAVLVLARAIRLRGLAVPFVGLTAVAWFVLLARPQPSVLRAALMGALGVVAVVTTGKRSGLRLLMAAVLLLLLVDPWLARSWGFALSVAATAGLLLFASRWLELLPRRWPRPLAAGVAVALAAQAATLPLSVALSGQVALLAVPANLAAMPAVPLSTVFGAAAAAVSPVAPWLATALAWCGQWPTAWIAAVAHRAATAPLATLAWPDGWWGGSLAAMCTVGLVGAWHALRRARALCGMRGRLAAVGSALLLVAVLLGPARWPPPGWVMVACDVGQGDALVVSTGPGQAMVIDAGPDPVLVDRCLDRLDIERIPLLVLTHDHADHVVGLPGVLAGRSVQTILVSPLDDPVENAEQVAARAGSTPVVDAATGQNGQIGPVRWRLLWPTRLIRGEGSDPNNASVVLMVEVGSLRLLLTGDVEPVAQQALVASGEDLNADVLKVPHHGSRYQDPAFLQAVGPRIALVSVGEDNTYGHPDPDLLQSLTDAGVVVGRTDLQGDLAVVLDGEQLRMVTQS